MNQAKQDYDIAREECIKYVDGLGIGLELKRPTYSKEPLDGGKPWQHVAWTGILKRGNVSIPIQYHMGIGCLDVPGRHHHTIYGEETLIPEEIRKICQQLKYKKPHRAIPTLCDILGCYCRDAIMANGVTWEDFAAELGYDVDSIKARKTWEACRDTYDNLRKLGMSHAEIEAVAEFANRF